MHFTDLFIRRPVLATVVSLVILLLGARAALELTVREYPELQNAQINVIVPYPGADAELVAGFITTPLEREIAKADGIDFMTSSTFQGQALITVNLRLDKDPNEALTEISALVNKLRNQLPEAAEDPIIEIAEGGETASMYLGFVSDVLDNSQITDYLLREVEPTLTAIQGIESAQILGDRTYAMRVWLEPRRMAAHDLTSSDVMAALRAQNVLSAVGDTKGRYVRVGLSANTDLRDPDEFGRIVVKSSGGAIVRLSDVARVDLGAESYEGSARLNGLPAVFIGLQVRPEANVLDVIDQVHEVWPDIVSRLPEGLEADIGFDATDYIRDAISMVQRTIIEAVIIVLVVIFLFLGSVRHSLIPAVTVPLSLIGVMFGMYLMGFTINLLTLLAMVLAIGLVVDDAIIVLENIHRHIEDGMKPYDAAITGARELVGPIIAMSLTLVSVFLPIGFMTGITGTLFVEFAFTLAGTVIISGIVALTLTPMMCAKILKPAQEEGNRLAHWLDGMFDRWREGYKRRLHGALDTVHVIGIFGVLVLGACYLLFVNLPNELAPAEDSGLAILINETDGYASLEYLDAVTRDAERIALEHEAVDLVFTLNAGMGQGTSAGFSGIGLKPWDQRDISTEQLVQELTPKIERIAGLRTAVIQPPPLPTPGQGYPVEFVLRSTAAPEVLAEVGNEVIRRAMATNEFFFMAPRQRIDRPETVIDIDRDKAALMGIDMQQLAADLSGYLAGGEVNRFALEGRSYRVIQQLERESRLNPEQLLEVKVRAGNGQLVPLSTIATVSDRVVPRSVERFQQLNSNTLVAVPRPDVTQGQALETLERIANDVMPEGFLIDYGGASRQFKAEGAALLGTFAFAMVIIYLVLAAQFESFRDPLIMLVTVPMSIAGALLVMSIFSITNGMQITKLPGMTLNIYTQVGLITLIGVISKHGILIVQFANKLQERGMAKREAIEEAASIRLRPILMTTASLVLAMIPLLIASGPGASARFAIGLVIAAGMTIGTLFTLYVVPAAYMYLGSDHAKSQGTAKVL